MNKMFVEKALLRATITMTAMMREMLRKNLEPMRISRMYYALSLINTSAVDDPFIATLVASQYENGSWGNGMVPTIWNASLLNTRGVASDSVALAYEYLLQSTDGYCWGRYVGDRLRIPTTGLLLYLMQDWPFPAISSEGLRDMWCQEFGCLTYKAAFFLLGLRSEEIQENQVLVNDTLRWIFKNQEDNGSFSPWLKHPIGDGNVVWTAQVCLAMMHVGVAHNHPCLQKAISWIVNSQMKQGIWPYHEIDEGIAWASLALNKYLKETHHGE